MARTKQPSLPVPASFEAAVVLMAEFVGDDRGALKVRLHYETAIDRLKAERDAVLAGIETVQKVRFAALKAWWEAGGKDLAGKRRSAELGGATLGVRLTPPAVKFGKGWNAAKVLAWLLKLRWADRHRFVRTKTELDKQAIIKAIGEPRVAKVFTTVLTVDQTDEFFIDTGLDPEAVRAEQAGKG